MGDKERDMSEWGVFVGVEIFPQRPRLRSPCYTRMLPDWDSMQVIPKPIDTLLARLARVSKFDEKSKTDMESVMNLPVQSISKANKQGTRRSHELNTSTTWKRKYSKIRASFPSNATMSSEKL